MTSVHHARLVRAKAVQKKELDVLPEFEIRDYYHDRFGIGEARDLVNVAYGRPLEAKEQLVVVRTEFITVEAQNALLKLLEEPPESTSFVFVLPPDLILLPTLRSRFLEEDEESDEAQSHEVFDEWLQSSRKDRLSEIETAIKAKDLDWQRSIKQGLIDFICNHNQPGSITALRELEFIARKLLTRGAANKMLFEHAAMLLEAR